MVEQIIDVWKLPLTTTQLVATAFDNRPDSSQLLIYEIQPLLEERGWSKVRILNRAGVAQKYVKSHPNVVLIDEFVGTGRSMVGRIQELRRHFEDNHKCFEYTIHVCVVAAMEAGIDAIRDNGVDVYADKSLKKGISDHFNGDDRDAATDRMLLLESKLMPKIDGDPLPSFGLGGAEALFARDDGNTPNSVFPIFWWPKDSKGRDRKTILRRFRHPNK